VFCMNTAKAVVLFRSTLSVCKFQNKQEIVDNSMHDLLGTCFLVFILRSMQHSHMNNLCITVNII
jgi:hypothetical protein